MLGLLLFVLAWITNAQAQGHISPNATSHAPEPYPYLSGGSFSGSPIPYSFDPLVNYVWNTQVNTTQLQIYNLLPVSVTADVPGSFTNLTSLTTSSPFAYVQGAGNIMFDFGVESAAWLEFDSPDLVLGESGYVEMSISEYNQPAIVNAGPPFPNKTAPPTQYTKTFRLELNPQLYEGVRFGWIHVFNVTKGWHITGVRAVCQIKPTNYTGLFITNNPVLTHIWYTGAYTVKLNLLEDSFGSILMDRGDRISWTGDAHTSQAAALVAFSNYDFIAENIERTSGVSNGIESYSLYWVLSVLDYYMYSGDNATFVNYIPSIVDKLTHALSIYGTNPSLGFYGHDVRVGCCFEDPSCTESQNAYMMLVIRICREFAEALGFANQFEYQQKYESIYNQLVAKLRSNPTWYESFGIHACADAINANFTTEAEQEAIFAQVFSDPTQLVSYAPFNQYFIITALGKMGKMDTALQAVNLCWGGQLSLGATTFWEVYSSQWPTFLDPHDPPVNGQNGYTSMCHPWAAGVTRWLSENVLGILPKAPGFSVFSLVPYTSAANNLTSVRGAVNTPNGPITVSYNNTESGHMEVQVPHGTVGKIGIPKSGNLISKVSYNGKTIYVDGTYLLDTVHEDVDNIYVENVGAGTHNFEITYSKLPLEEKQTEHVSAYTATFLGNDTVTQGNWINKYGTEGYYLFAFSNGSQPVYKLPSFVSQVDWTTVSGVGNPRFFQFTSGSTDARALQNPSSPNSRALGAIATQDPSACFQTFHFDIILAAPTQFEVSLYLVDFDNQEREFVVEVYDEQTKNIIAPYQYVTNFQNGVYMKYQYNQSVQLRLSQVRGGDAVVSGLFFD